MVHKINTKDIRKQIESLCAGDSVLLTGTIYTARDAAHKRIVSLMEEGKTLPFNIRDAVIYYAGPTPAKNGLSVGSCGPTTSSRMDVFSPMLIQAGLCGMIGKGQRNDATIEAMKKYGAAYFCAIGGAGALSSKAIKKSEVVAFEELGCESIKKMYVEDFPLIVGIDCKGNSLFNR